MVPLSLSFRSLSKRSLFAQRGKARLRAAA
jgi:hypothetical protein